MQQKNGLRSTIKGAWCMPHTFFMQQWGLVRSELSSASNRPVARRLQTRRWLGCGSVPRRFVSIAASRRFFALPFLRGEDQGEGLIRRLPPPPFFSPPLGGGKRRKPPRGI